jgi:hypothetical protein
MIVLLAVAVVVMSTPILGVLLVSLASRREDSALTLGARPTSGIVAAGRRLTGFHGDGLALLPGGQPGTGGRPGRGHQGHHGGSHHGSSNHGSSNHGSSNYGSSGHGGSDHGNHDSGAAWGTTDFPGGRTGAGHPGDDADAGADFGMPSLAGRR